jgi:Zn-dependent alcohol dehydrogenase
LQGGVIEDLGLEVDNDAVEDLVIVLRNGRFDVLQCQFCRSNPKKMVQAQ